MLDTRGPKLINTEVTPNSIVQINLEKYDKDAKVILQSHHRKSSNHSQKGE